MRHYTPSVHRLFACLISAFLFSTVVMPVAAFQASTPEASPQAATLDPANVGPRFIIRPVDGADGDYFTLKADAGTTNQLTVVLANADTEPLSLRTYVANAIPIVNGGFAVASEDAAQADQGGVASWIDYPAETYDFEPGKGVERTFTVTIPQDAKPGQYIAGLSLQTAEPIDVPGTDLLNQVISKTIAVFIIVPGPEKPAFDLGEAEVLTDSALSRIVIPVNNTGNILVKPAGDVTVKDATGKTVLTAPVQMGSVYAGRRYSSRFLSPRRFPKVTTPFR